MNDAQNDTTLPTIVQLFSELDKRQIRYVHWKSNNNISRALGGEDDLDLLVHPADAREFEVSIDRMGFQRALTHKDRWQPRMYHYYRPDVSSRVMVHLHLHYALTLGYDYHKNFTLPIVDWYLEGRRRVREVYLPEPEKEYVVFVIRVLIKHARAVTAVEFPLPQLRHLLGRGTPRLLGALTSSEMSELETLSESVCRERLRVVLTELNELNVQITLDAFEIYERTIAEAASGRNHISSAARHVKKTLQPHRQSGESLSISLAAARLNNQRLRALGNRLHLRQLRSKQNITGGRIIAFIGGDGAGKSTNVDSLSKVLGKAFTTTPIHVGRPRRAPAGAIVSLTAKAAAFVRMESTGTALRNVSLALNRRAAFRRAEQVREGGGIAVLDRLPHPNITHMDSPRIKSTRGRFERFLSAYEQKLYNTIVGVDLAIILRLDPEIALLRRPEDDPSVLRQRSGEVWEGNWSGAQYFSIDTGINDPGTVGSKVLDRSWQTICSQRIRSEISGLSGVGKSSVVSMIEEEIANTRRSLPYKQYPVLLVAALIEELVRGRIPRTRVDLKITTNLAELRWFVKLVQNHGDDMRLLSHNYVLDQGPVFQISLAVREGRMSTSDRIFTDSVLSVSKWLQRAILLEAPEHLLRSRVKARPDLTRSKLLPSEQLSKFYEEYSHAFEQVLCKLNFVERVSSDRALAEVVDEVRRRLGYRDSSH